MVPVTFDSFFRKTRREGGVPCPFSLLLIIAYTCLFRKPWHFLEERIVLFFFPDGGAFPVPGQHLGFIRQDQELFVDGAHQV